MWIRKNEGTDWQPKIFQIKGDDSILVAADDIRKGDSPNVLIFGIAGLFFILLSAATIYPDKFRFLVTGSKS